MKFRCTSKVPVAVVLNGEITLVSEGEVIDVAKAPKGGFVAVEPPKPVKKTVKKTTKKVTQHADSTETSSVW